jgi:hypothetical protein
MRLVAAAGTLTLFACSTTAPSDEGPPVLCNGEDNLVLAATTGGGNYNGVPSVAQEVPYSFLVIDGRCRFWALDAWEHPVRTGTLTAEQATTFAQDWQLGTWQPRVPQGCPDASTTTLRFRNDTIQFSCESDDLLDRNHTWTADLYAAGTDLEGAARYCVWNAESTSPWPQSEWVQRAPAWPLDVPPGSIAAVTADQSVVQPAEGADAAQLRDLRSVYLAAPFPSAYGPGRWIPVVYDVDAGPSYYDVAVRDVTPFEVNDQFSPDAFF